jgi:hypothetical protein
MENVGAKVAAIKELREYNHGFLPRGLVKELTEPFGFVGECYLEPVTPNDPKGLWRAPKNSPGMMDGCCSWELAIQICAHVGVTSVPDVISIGGGGTYQQLRAACDAVLNQLGVATEEDFSDRDMMCPIEWVQRWREEHITK